MATIKAISRSISPGDEVKVTITNQMVFVRNETPIVDPSDQSGRTFTTNYEFIPDTLCVTLNGMRQRPGIEYDFEEKGGNLFRFNYSIDEEDVVLVDYIKIMGSPQITS